MFFVFSGLNTQIGLVNTPTLWVITLLIIAMPTAVNYAILCKGIACMLAAKLAGICNYRCFDECSWFNGVNHAQYWS